jgi:hypothetical protein
VLESKDPRVRYTSLDRQIRKCDLRKSIAAFPLSNCPLSADSSGDTLCHPDCRRASYSVASVLIRRKQDRR